MTLYNEYNVIPPGGITLGGLFGPPRVVGTHWLTITINHRIPIKLWKRIFSFKPWIKYRRIYKEIPSKKVYIMNGIIYCHTSQVERMNNALDKYWRLRNR